MLMGLKPLLKRAVMTIEDFHTGVVRSTCGVGRVGISSSARPQEWGDCCCLQMMFEGNPYWHYLHLSPARARVLAQHLLQQADRLEARDPGMNIIDKVPNDARTT